MKGSTPRISVVIPNLNYGRYLEETLLSVIGQSYPATEVIVMDGHSVDDSAAVIRKYEDFIHHWVSEPDNGQADAINKGLAVATGELVVWMNSDDYVAPGAFQAVASAWRKHPEAFVYCGHMTCFSRRKQHPPVRMKVYPTVEQTLVFGSMSSPSMYFRTEKFREVGLLREDLHYCFDFEFWCRFLERYGPQKLFLLDENLAFFRLHSKSKTVSFPEKFSAEQYLVLHSIACSYATETSGLIPAPADLGIRAAYSRKWDFSPFDGELYTALVRQFLMERFNGRLSCFTMMKWFAKSFHGSPSGRGARFYLMPFRIMRWTLLQSLGLQKTWVDEYRED